MPEISFVTCRLMPRLSFVICRWLRRLKQSCDAQLLIRNLLCETPPLVPESSLVALLPVREPTRAAQPRLGSPSAALYDARRSANSQSDFGALREVGGQIPVFSFCGKLAAAALVTAAVVAVVFAAAQWDLNAWVL